MSIFTNPTPQLLDNNGSPLPGAKLFFFETGTSTLKTIYSDSSFTTAQSNPVIADGNGRITSDVYLDGVYRVVGKTSGGVNIDGWDKDPVGTVDTTAFGAWANDSTYNIPDIVKGSDDNFYQTLTDVNQGNDPTTDAVNWAVLNLQTLTAATAGNIYYGGASAAGTDTYAFTLSTSPVAYAAGQRFQFLADVANTGACTANANALGAKSIKLLNGKDPYDGAIQVGPVDVFYDGTNFVLLSQFGIAPTYCGASAAGTDTYAVTAPGLPTAYAAGDRYSFKADVANTGACTVNFNAIGAGSIKLPDGSDPFDNAIPAGSIPIVEHDGTNFILQNAYYTDAPTFDVVKTFTANPVILNSGASFLEVKSSGANTLARGVYFYDQAGSASGAILCLPNTIGTDSELRLYVGGLAAGDIKLTIDDDGLMLINGNTVWDDSGSNGPAAVAGYTKVGSGFYAKDNATVGATFLTYDTLTAVAAPAGATALKIKLQILLARASAAGTQRFASATGYTSSAGTTSCDYAYFESTEEVSGTGTLATCTFDLIVPVDTGNGYIKFTSRDSVNPTVAYAVFGYYI